MKISVMMGKTLKTIGVTLVLTISVISVLLNGSGSEVLNRCQCGKSAASSSMTINLIQTT